MRTDNGSSKRGEATARREAEAAEVWGHLKDIDDAQALEDFLRRYEGTNTWDNAAKQRGYVVAPIGFGGTDDEERLLKPGDMFQDAEFAPEMVVVPAGSFMMGSKEGEVDDSERPQRKVTIAQPFAVGRYAITFEEWDAYVADVGSSAYVPYDQGWGRGRRPVINVAWDDITNGYLPWLMEKTGKTYRLLSEAEWEYCCRVGTATAYATGGTITPEHANFEMNEKGTTAVRKYKPNDFGLHNMHGNVWEWYQDNWHESYNDDPPGDGSVWRGGDTSFRTVRGGSWCDDPRNLRSANRHRDQPDIRIDSIGFRIARTLAP